MNEKELQEFLAKQNQLRYEQQRTRHEHLNRSAVKGQIVLAGSSLMEMFPIEEMAQRLPERPIVYNRGIGGDTLAGFEARLDSAVIDLMPGKLFINIGTNDISAPDYVRSDMLAKYRAILERIRAALPDTRIIVMSYYPVNRTERFDTSWFGARTNAEIDAVNAELETMAQEMGLGFVNVTDCLRDENGDLIAALSIDGMHMTPDGYERVFSVLRPFLTCKDI